MIGYLRFALEWIANSDKVGMQLMRVAIAIVFLWIGALKFAPYEADSITPFVANSPFLSFFLQASRSVQGAPHEGGRVEAGRTSLANRKQYL
jgi:reactive chlorine resistance protein C